jgi:hypothetical protein
MPGVLSASFIDYWLVVLYHLIFKVKLPIGSLDRHSVKSSDSHQGNFLHFARMEVLRLMQCPNGRDELSHGQSTEPLLGR